MALIHLLHEHLKSTPGKYLRLHCILVFWEATFSHCVFINVPDLAKGKDKAIFPYCILAHFGLSFY